MAHVLDLPGCFVRAADRGEALCLLPAAIQEYIAWLQRHSEDAGLMVENVQIKVEEDIQGCGPFNPGNAAGLFTPEKRAVSDQELEFHLRLMEYTRIDLLEMASDLPDEILDWLPDAASFSIRRILRHIGNSEEWYVSRLVPPENLPAEWETDESLPLLEFLSMERRTAMNCLRQLTAAQRSQVFHPNNWTSHPDEAWSLRKVLRRFLEHEREHATQIGAILAQWRAQRG
jgi:uncharacterized damage-inducible protein DinB